MTQLQALPARKAQRSKLLDSFKRGKSTVELREGLGFLTGHVIVIRDVDNGRYRVLRSKDNGWMMFNRLFVDLMFNPW